MGARGVKCHAAEGREGGHGRLLLPHQQHRQHHRGSLKRHGLLDDQQAGRPDGRFFLPNHFVCVSDAAEPA